MNSVFNLIFLLIFFMRKHLDIISGLNWTWANKKTIKHDNRKKMLWCTIVVLVEGYL